MNLVYYIRSLIYCGIIGCVNVPLSLSLSWIHLIIHCIGILVDEAVRICPGMICIVFNDIVTNE